MQGRLGNRPYAFAFFARPDFADAVFFLTPAFAVRFDAALTLAFGFAFGFAPRGRFGAPGAAVTTGALT